MKATTIRIGDSTLDRVDGIAKTLSRTRSWVINQAIERFLDYEEWYVQEVNKGLDEVQLGDIASQEEVAVKFKQWDVDAS